MDRDYIWEGEYGRRSHLIPVFQQLLREQDASSLQMLSLFVNNNPYNLEFFIAVSYDRPKEEHLDRMFRLLEDAGLRQRKDLTALNIMRAMADRRFNSASLLDEDSVPTIMGHLFFFPEIRVLEEKGYRMTPFGREQMVFLSHSSLDKPEIEEIIPHRHPFLLVDYIEDYEPGEFAVGYKCVTFREDFFRGHFPKEPVMPGVLMVEALAQVGAVAILSLEDMKGKTAYFGGINKCKFRRKVVPGDKLRLETKIIRRKGPVGIGSAVASVDGEVAVEAELTFMIG